MDNLDLMVHQTIHDYPGGAVALAKAINVRSGTLNNKADPGCEQHVLNVHELQAVLLTTKDVRILKTLAADWQGQRERTVESMVEGARS